MKRLNVSDILGTETENKNHRDLDLDYDIITNEDNNEPSLQSLIDEVLNAKHKVPPDLRIDDRDLKEFPNFYSWCFSKDGGNQAPFAKQLAFGTHLFSEYCPRCSSKAFRNIAKIPVDFPAIDFPDKVTFLEYGQCPKCGVRKSELVASGELNFYQELALCAGQRCVTGSTILLRDTGLHRFSLFDDVYTPYGYTNLDIGIHNGYHTTKTTQFYKARPESLIKVTLRCGLDITGTKDHPVYTNNGFIKLPNLLGEYVCVVAGTKCQGNVLISDDRMGKTFNELPDDILGGTMECQIKYLKSIGIDLFEKDIQLVRLPKGKSFIKDIAIVMLNLGYVPKITNSILTFDPNIKYDVPTHIWDRAVYIEDAPAEETFDITVPDNHTFVANGILNHNSGKSAFFQLAVPYLAHKWLKINKPVETLGLMKDSILVASFGALTYAKSVELLWQPISNAIEDSKWFQQYFEILDYYGDKSGTELYKFKDTYLSFNHKNMIFAPVGPSKRKLRGSTRILAILDEIGWFPHGEDNEQKEMANANEVYVALDRSLKTVRNACERLLDEGWDNIPNGYMAGISSPSSYNDKIMTLIRTHEGSREVLTGQFPTWEMNPMFKKSDFAKEYRDDPIKAERDFGANPPMATNPWVSDINAIKHLFINPYNISYRYEYYTDKSGHNRIYAKIKGVHKPTTVPASVLAIDAGYSNNSFALSIASPILDTEGNPKGAKVLALAEVAPKRGQNVVSFAKNFKELLIPLIAEFNVQLVATDRWQSIKLLEDLENETKVQTNTYSLKPMDFEYIRDYLYDDQNLIILPKPEIPIEDIFRLDMNEYPHCFKYMPNAHLLHQFSSVSLDSRGNVDKGTGFTDDLLRATCLAISYCLNEDDVKTYKLNGATTNAIRAIGTKVGSTSIGSSIGSRSGSSSIGSSTMGARG